MNIGENLRKLRQRKTVERTMSQSDLAELTGLKPSHINHFECNRRTPSVENAIKLAEALGVSLDELAKGCFHD